MRLGEVAAVMAVGVPVWLVVRAWRRYFSLEHVALEGATQIIVALCSHQLAQRCGSSDSLSCYWKITAAEQSHWLPICLLRFSASSIFFCVSAQ